MDCLFCINIGLAPVDRPTNLEHSYCLAVAERRQAIPRSGLSFRTVIAAHVHRSRGAYRGRDSSSRGEEVAAAWRLTPILVLKAEFEVGFVKVQFSIGSSQLSTRIPRRSIREVLLAMAKIWSGVARIVGASAEEVARVENSPRYAVRIWDWNSNRNRTFHESEASPSTILDQAFDSTVNWSR